MRKYGIFFQIVAERYDLRQLDDPVGFVKKNAVPGEGGFTRVVVFRETKKGHFDSTGRYHAVQVKSDLQANKSLSSQAW